MKRTMLTGVLSLLAVMGMGLSANAQFPVLRGVARNAVQVATPAVNVEVGGGAAVAPANVVVENAAGVAVVARRPWIARQRVIAGAAVNSSASATSTATAQATVSAAPAYVAPAPTVDCCGNVIYSGGGATSSSYTSSTSYASSSAVSSSVVTRTAPVATNATVTRSVIARPVVGAAVGAGVNVSTPRVGVFVGR